MPTQDGEAFVKLVENRERLNAISTELRKALDSCRVGILSDERLRELQKKWDEAFREFQMATDEFSKIARRIHRPDFDADPSSTDRNPRPHPFES